jgi:hypothetical protein
MVDSRLQGVLPGADILGELGGLADDEVAVTLGIGRANAKVRLHRTRAQLRNQIEARCDFYQQELSCKPLGV